VESEDRLDEVMDRIQERLVAPIVTDVRLEGDGIEIVDDSVVPAKRPSLFPGVPLVLRGRLQGAGPGNVTIRGKKQGGSTWRVAVTSHSSQAPGLGALWARGRLQHLSDAYAVGEHDDSEALERRIVDLSIGFGVLCKFTAVVAIDPRTPEKPIEASTLRQIVQPVFDVQMRLHHWIAPPSSFSSYETDHCFALCDYSEASPLSEARAPSDDDSHGYDVGDLDPPPVNRPAEQAMIRETLALLRPRSGRLDDVPTEMVSMLLSDVSKVLAMLRADGWNSPWLETLERVLEVGKQTPLDRDALRALLDGLALFASPFERWW
jgi:Ca-activated chloride channel family protein